MDTEDLTDLKKELNIQKELIEAKYHNICKIDKYILRSNLIHV